MVLENISDYADACLNRPYLTRWFPSNMALEQSSYSYGRTEMAFIEEALRYIERGHSLFIYDPIPSNRILLAMSLAYARTQDPRFPDDGIVGQGKTLLIFPALHHGYVSDLDDLRLDTPGKSTPLLERTPIDRLSRTQLDAEINTAKNNFEFDTKRPDDGIGAIFVDLRKPEWSATGRQFDEVMALYEAANCPVIFYSDEMSPAEETVERSVNSVHLTNELLTTSDSDNLPKNPSITTQLEHLINTSNVTVEHVTIGYPDMYQIVTDLSSMRDDLQRSGSTQSVIKMEVGWLFNLLTRLPIKPEYWDSTVEDNYYQQGVRELLENLRGKADRLEGREAPVLVNFCQAADALQGRLNTNHPLQQNLFKLITVGGDSDHESERTVVVNSKFERKAILQAITYEDRQLAPEVTIRTTDELEPTPDAEAIVPRPLDNDSYLYDFPIASHIVFVQYESWSPIIEDRIEDGLTTIGATIEKHEIGQMGGPEKPQEPNNPPNSSPDNEMYDRPGDTSGADVSESLRNDFEDPNNRGTSTSNNNGRGSAPNPDLELELSNGRSRKLSAQSRVSVLKPNGDIGRKQARDLESNETILLLDSAAKDIYDMFVENAHEKDRLRKAESTVERWRSILQDGLNSEMTEEELLFEMQNRGSDISDQATVSTWRTGKAIGPRDGENVRIILEIFSPEMAPTADATATAMKKIRQEHRAIGRRAREAIETQVSTSIGESLTTNVPDDIDQASEKVQKAEIDTITTISA